MTIPWDRFIGQLCQGGPLMMVVVLTLGVILVNGWTDAPNAIATCVATGSMPFRSAVLMAAVFNFLGVLVMTWINARVAMTIYSIADFGGDAQDAMIALCAAMFAIVLWATAAWYYGIPTSESHALIAGISGAAIALQSGWGGIRLEEWMKVIIGLIWSTLAGFFLGFMLSKVLAWLMSVLKSLKWDRWLRRGQIAAGAAMAFMHGAQDGQKFMGVFLLGVFLAMGQSNAEVFVIPLWLMILCSLVMALGTSIGGYRIIRTVSMELVELQCHQGFASDVAASAGLLAASLYGIPVSTTHMKTSAIMGAGASESIRSVNWKIGQEMVLTWILTFPLCGGIGYLGAKILFAFFH